MKPLAPNTAAPPPRDLKAATRRWRRLTPFMLGAMALMLLVVWIEYEAALVAWKSELTPPPYFTLLAVAGTVGLPTTPFYVLASTLFGPWAALSGAMACVFSYQLSAYLIARGPLRRWSDAVGRLVDKGAGPGWMRSPAARIVVVRLVPGVPGALKNYAAASVGASLPMYLAVSWPLGFIGAAALVVLGDSVSTQRPEEAALALMLLLPIGVLAHLLRRAHRARIDLRRLLAEG